MADTKISPYSLPDLKNTTDDALGNYLRGIGFKQDNTKADVKLLVGYLAVIIAGATFVADYKLGWEATKGWTAVAVAAYAILNGVFTYWLWFVEAGLVFEGSKDGKKVCCDHSLNPSCIKLTVKPSGGFPLENTQERPDVLPRRDHYLALLDIIEHQTDQDAFHYLVHSRRILCCQAVPAMDRKQRGGCW